MAEVLRSGRNRALQDYEVAGTEAQSSNRRATLVVSLTIAFLSIGAYPTLSLGRTAWLT